MSDNAKPSKPTDSSPRKSDFEFTDWSTLAISDPVTFENKREQIIEDFIQSVPKSRQHRLRCLQWRIDQTRKLSRNPMDACIKLSQLMMESVYGENGLIDALKGLHREINGTGASSSHHSQTQEQKGKILQFAPLNTAPEFQ